MGNFDDMGFEFPEDDDDEDDNDTASNNVFAQSDDDGDFNFEDDAPIQTGNTNSGGKISAEKAKDYKKTGLMLIGIAVLLLIVTAVGIRVVKNVKNKPKSSGEIQTVQSDINSNINTNNQQNQNSVPSQNVVSNIGQSSVSWQEINLSGSDLSGSVWIESAFTITELKHYAAVTNGQSDKQVKSVAKGNISGLVGTYEVELPTYQAVGLSVGTTFKVSYQLKDQGAYKVIGQIKY